MENKTWWLHAARCMLATPRKSHRCPMLVRRTRVGCLRHGARRPEEGVLEVLVARTLRGGERTEVGVVGLVLDDQVVQVLVDLLPPAQPRRLHVRAQALARKRERQTVRQAVEASGVHRLHTLARLGEVVGVGDHLTHLLACVLLRVVRVRLGGLQERLRLRREVVHLLHRAASLRVVHVAVHVLLVERALRRVDGQHRVVHADAVPLRVRVREQPRLEHLLVAGLNTRHKARRGERDLLVLQELRRRVLVEHELANLLQGKDVRRPDLRRVEGVEAQLLHERVVHRVKDLHVERPAGAVGVVLRLRALRRVARLDLVVQVDSREAERLLHRLGVRQRRVTLPRLVRVAHPVRLAGGVDPLERVHTVARELAEVGRDADVVHQPREHVDRLREAAEVVPDPPPLLHSAQRVRLQGTDHVRETDTVADEEDREVQSHNVHVALLRVHLQRESTRVTQVLRGALRVNHSRPPARHRRLLAHVLEHLRHRVRAPVLRQREVALRRRTTGVHVALRRALTVVDLKVLNQAGVLEQNRAVAVQRLRVNRIVDGGTTVGGVGHCAAERALKRSHQADGRSPHVGNQCVGAMKYRYCSFY
eukprot:Rhum_TRINITY_DN14400_c0_g1::Rhum_TRINITY_DN14400_c0_g1_i1::g.87281::m.87281